MSPIFFALSKGYVQPTHKCFSRRTFWNGLNIFICKFLILLVPKTGIEPAQDLVLHAPKACASANSATSAKRL